MITYVYRVFAADGTLLYVGMSGNVKKRMRQHAKSAEWFDQQDRVETTEYPDRESARAAEGQAIADEDPEFNRQRPHTGGTSKADRAAIDAAIADFDVSGWAPLNDAERDLVSRAFRAVTPVPAPARSRTAAPA